MNATTSQEVLRQISRISGVVAGAITRDGVVQDSFRLEAVTDSMLDETASAAEEMLEGLRMAECRPSRISIHSKDFDTVIVPADRYAFVVIMTGALNHQVLQLTLNICKELMRSGDIMFPEAASTTRPKAKDPPSDS